MTSRKVYWLLLLVPAALTGLGLGAASVLSGCKAVQSAADSMADATSGTALSGVLRGTARLAESMRSYSAGEEHYIGRSVAAQILSRYKVHPDPALQDYVNLVGLSVLAAPEPKRTATGYHFVVLEGDELQAVSTPGGFIFLTEGTVRRAKDEDELAAVLAHEIAHVSLGHGIGAIKAATRKKSAALIAQGVGQGASEIAQTKGTANQKQLVELTALFADAIQDITGNLLEKGYSRDLEVEADKMGAQYLQSSGYARAALASYLQGIAKESQGGKGGWFATHPSPLERVKELGDLAMGASPGQPIRRERFQKALGGG